MSEMPLEIVTALQERWAKAFAEGNVDALLGLYAQDCFLFGSKPALSRGRSGVRAYFMSALPEEDLRAEFGAQSVRQLGPAVIVSAGFVAFSVADAAPLSYRISLTLVREEGQWQIASHHASPVPDP